MNRILITICAVAAILFLAGVAFADDTPPADTDADSCGQDVDDNCSGADPTGRGRDDTGTIDADDCGQDVDDDCWRRQYPDVADTESDDSDTSDGEGD